MILYIKKNINLANPNVSLPHWHFKKDEIINVNDDYLINRLIKLDVACEHLSKENKEKKKEKNSDKHKDKSLSDTVRKMMKEKIKNKKLEIPLNKSDL